MRLIVAYPLLLLFLLVSCETIDKQSQKETEKLSKFLQQPESELKIVMGEPDKITYDNKGSKFFLYKKKLVVQKTQAT